MRRGRGSVKSPTYHVRMVKGRHPRHRFATPPITHKQGFQGSIPSPAVFGHLGCAPFPVVSTRFRTCALYSLDKTAKVGIYLGAALPKCGAGSARGRRTSVLRVLPNCKGVR